MHKTYTVQHFGRPSLVFLHGWGANSAVWRDVIEHFSQTNIMTIDLPGYGENHSNEHSDFDRACEFVAEKIPDRSIVVAWSLGGLIASYIASQYRFKIKKLILVANNPCFVEKADWPCGLDKSVLAQFARQLFENHKNTLSRFLSLQARAGRSKAATLKTLREACFKAKTPSLSTLRAGLTWLEQQDLRQHLSRINNPTHFIFGEKDTIVKLKVAKLVKTLNSKLTTHVIVGAAHAPFISHSDLFCEYVNGLICSPEV